METPTTSSSFTRFPAEIRNKIYRYSLPTETTIYVAIKLFDHHTIRTKTAVALACTCHEIRDEVMPIFFGSNKFTFAWGFQMYEFMINIGQKSRQMLRQLEFGWNHNERHHLAILTDCSNLQRLHIGLHHLNIEDIRYFNTIENTNIGIWEWAGQGAYIWDVLCQLPHGLDVKIREVMFFEDEQISVFFEGSIKPVYTGFISDGLVEKFEVEVKESLRRLSKTV